MVRGEVTGDSCGAAGTKIQNSQCFKKDASVFNHLKFTEVGDEDTDKQAIKEYDPSLRSRAELNRYVKEYQEKLNCSVDDKKWVGRAKENTGSAIGNALRKFTDVFTFNKNKGEGRDPEYNTMVNSTIDRYNHALPLCCQTGPNQFNVVANECACYASSIDTANSQAPKIVGASSSTCSELKEAMDSTEELKVRDSDSFLTEQLEDFMGDKTCQALYKAELMPPKDCKPELKDKPFILYSLDCAKTRKIRKKQKVTRTTMLCHRELHGSNKNKPFKVNYEQLQNQGSDLGCHIAEKF